MTLNDLSNEFKKMSGQLDFLSQMSKLRHNPVKGVSNSLAEAQNKFEEVVDAFCEGWIAYREHGGRLE